MNVQSTGLDMKKIEISGHEEEVIERLVSSGCYTSAEQAIKVSVRLLDKHEEEKLSRLRHEVALGVAAAKEGRVAPSHVEKAKKRYRQQHSSA